MQRVSAFVLVLLALAAVRAEAQQALGVGLGAVGGYYWLEGDDFEEVDPGPGVEGALRISLFNRLQLGGGAHFSRHRIDFLDTDVDVVMIFAEPRLTFGREWPRVAPFIAGRVGYALQSADVRTTGGRVEVDAAGYVVGGVAGLEFPLNRHVALEFSGTYYWISLGEAEVSGTPLTLPEASGAAIGARGGLNLHF
jgi:hypothetical protein